MLFMWWFIRLW